MYIYRYILLYQKRKQIKGNTTMTTHANLQLRIKRMKAPVVKYIRPYCIQ